MNRDSKRCGNCRYFSKRGDCNYPIPKLPEYIVRAKVIDELRQPPLNGWSDGMKCLVHEFVTSKEPKK